ncbi:MAG: hypothetical protein KatS3mg053_1549 [Candidatus Roseilinea sp.]|nr:MAG: hypothetical protein KatS3mg053_1549 [Candidatus Roseilinea sp.]
MTQPAEITSTRTIGQIVRNAAIFKFRSTLAMDADDLATTVAEFFSLLETRNVDYVLVGGIALLRYVEGRNTEDLDLIVAVNDLAKLPEVRIGERSEYFVRGTFGSLQIDFLLTRNKLFDHVRRKHATVWRFTEQAVPCATVEGLLLLKLYALPSLYRQGDFTRVNLYEADIAALMQAYRPDMQPLFGTLAKYLSDSDLQEVRSIISDIQTRIARFERGVGGQKSDSSST